MNFDDGDSDDLIELAIAEASKIMAAGRALLTFDGDHFITLPLLRAAHKHYGKVALLHFDAHTDNEESDLADNHGSMFYRGAGQR